MPEFEWNGGHSGRQLPEAYREILDGLWGNYESRFRAWALDGRRADRSSRPKAGIDEAVALAAEALFDKKDQDGTPLIIRSVSAGLAGQTEEEKVTGFLSPVLTNTGWTAGDLREKGFSEMIIDSLVNHAS